MVGKSLNRSNIARFLVLLTSLGQVSLDELAASLGVKLDDLRRWQVDGAVPSPDQLQRLIEFCNDNKKNGLAQLLADSGIVIPTYDWRETFAENVSHGPLGVLPSPGTLHALLRMPTYLCGRRLNFPIGVPASALTANSLWASFYAQRGFDLITYKTVRPRAKDAHPAPNWVTLGHIEELTAEDVATPQSLKPQAGNWLQFSRQISMANSFGIPSTDPAEWKEDVKRAKAWLGDGQLLAVSVFSEGAEEEEFIAGYVKAATVAAEAGADIIEANLSCPNTFVSGKPVDVYRQPELASKIASAIKQAIRGVQGDLPLFIKIGYLPREGLVRLLKHTADDIDGVTAINAVSMPIQKSDGSAYFPPAADGTPRENAGLSGGAIRGLGMEVVSNVIELRRSYKPELAVIAVGGVMSSEDFAAYLRLGADAVQSCAGAWLNPDLALECRLHSYQQREGTRMSTALREAEAASKALFVLYDADKLSPDQLGEALKDDLRPSDIEIARQYSLLVASLEGRSLIESIGDEGVPLYRLTAKGRNLVKSVREISQANRQRA